MSSVEDFDVHGEVMFDPFAGPDIALSVASTAPQREVWTGAQMGREASLAFNEASVLDFTGPLDVAALIAAVGDVLERHEALRATFSRDGLTMLVNAHAAMTLPVIDLTGLADEERDPAHAALRAAAVETPFDLEQGPLARFTLVRLGGDAHELIFAAHHIVCDGWSLGVIVSDLARCYTARVRGARPALPDADRFSDYAVAMAVADSGPERADDLRYWTSKYAGAAPVLDLPTDRPRPVHKTYGSAREDRLVSPERLQRVRAAGAKSGCSLFATLLTGFTAMVHRLTGDDDIVIGVPSAGQSASCRTGVVGHCVNMLPIRVGVDPGKPVDELLARVKVTALDAFEHQGLGFGGLLEHISVPRDPSRVPLIGVSFNVDRTLGAAAMQFDGVHTSIETIARVSENFDLSVNAIESDAGLQLECQYNTELFDAATIRRWLTTYETLLDGLASSTAQPVGALPVLTDDDRAILARCNDTARAVPVLGLVHALVEATVRETPEAVAVQFADRTLTYAALNGRANRIARHLRAQGVQRGVLVAVLLERSEEMLAALLGVLKSGAGYVYLDPNYPAERLQFMAADTAAPVLLTDTALANSHGIAAPCIVRIDADASAIDACAHDDLLADEASATPEDTAYVVYTSGSTGTPKGCLLPHRSLINVMVSAMHEPGMTRDDVMLNVTTASFDIGSLELFMPLLLGARVVIAPRSDVVDGERLKALIATSRATLMFGTPAMWRILLENGWEGKRDLTILCGGEKLALDLARDLATRVAHVWNIYGPTETTVFSTLWRVPTPVDRVLIGHLAANTHIAVLDPHGNEVPVGVQGELFIGGRGVTNGYINRPELTAERFVSIASHPGERFYRTGDLVRVRADAELEYVGRNDDQVKVRGFRVEPGEIDAVLRTFAGVQQVVVVPREDRANDLRLVAYVITTGAPMDVDGMREHVKRALPAFMVPNAFVQLEAFPMTPSGKIDRRALPAPAGGAPSASSGAQVPPATANEEILAALWCQILGIGSVGVTDDFFALGGHSLLASQLLSRLRRDHGVQLTFRNVFEQPTIRGLGQLIDAASAPGADAAATVDSIPHRADASDAPLSVLQERLWLLEELEPTQRAAHAHSASWRLFGALNADRLDQAIHAFIARHPSMRTSFHTIDGVRRQVVAPVSHFVLDRRDLTALTPEAQDPALQSYFREQQFTTFDIATAPLFRACLLRLGDEHHMLYSLQHGMIWDGWSFDLFLKEVTELYAAEEQGRAPQLEPLTVTYGDFAEWQAGWLSGPEATKQAEWWKQQLSGELQELALPADYPRPAESSGAGNQISLPFSTDEAERLRALARRYDGTLFMVIFAAYNAVLHHYTGQEDLLVASPVRARTRPELEVVVGPFVNTVMLRTSVHATMRFPDLLRAVRDVTLDSFSNQELPFELLGTRVPAVRALFSMQDARTRPVEMGSLRVEQYHVPQYVTTNDLMLWMMESRSKLYAVLKYSTELFDDATGQLFLTQLRAFLMAVLDDPERTIGEIELTTPEERGRVALPTSAPVEPVTLQVARVAAAHPGKIAVRAGRLSLTYGELSDRARRIANGLVGAGVAPAATVAVVMPPGIERVTSLLGVLYAGAAPLLIDAEDPAAYIARCLAATGARFVIADDARDLPGVIDLRLSQLMTSPPISATVSAAADAPATLLAMAAGIGGTIVSHAVLGAQVNELATALALTDADTCIATLAAAAPTAIIELLVPLTRGATLVIADDDERVEPDDLRDLLEEHDGTVMLAGGAVWRSLLATRWQAPADFRGVLVAGAFPDAADVRTLAGRVSRGFTLLADVADGGAASLALIQPTDGMGFAATSGLAGAVVDVVDGAGRLAPMGVPGRLRVSRGTMSASGARRARRMPGERVQLVSDVASELWIDGIVVSSSVIEVALTTHAPLREAAVSVRRDASGTPRVVAWVVASTGATFTELDLRNALRTQLPRSFVPQRFVSLASLPRDAEGDIRYDRLESPFSDAMAAMAQFVAPRTDTEALLARLWQDALDVERVGLLDNFFKLGGTSLLCFRIVEQVRKATGQHLSPRALLVGTLQQAASELSQQPAATPGVSVADQPAGLFAKLKGLIS